MSPMREEKRADRLRVMQLYQQRTPRELAEQDAALWARLRSWLPYAEAGSVFLYAGAAWEPNTRVIAEDVLARGVPLGFPLCCADRHMVVRRVRNWAELESGPHGVLQPPPTAPLMSVDEIALTIVPAMAFDRQGHRLGRGGGFYDRFLKTYGGLTAGLCRSFLLFDRVPQSDWDRPVDAVLTESETLLFVRSECPSQNEMDLRGLVHRE